ncbi:hypothetical protein VCRA2113O118_420008 [Vibrio crassostreae]|nr:hypothetical protein VCRA2112O115_450008 [Vibrio crassostreae]CAK2344226.1 hypothetical protein VCRA2112O114_460008 [Vibrio crassostreae]CAK2938219.1 hypothetical protein VCRA2119O125_420008 [Vibrio crassostreae]CAK2957244.1 hypothetical protein VCRA2113O118_420008 [Vibrio crassostreae]CAK2984561.1 hypothetical protein VCRA217O111_420008 [Vibrio crassostreae]
MIKNKAANTQHTENKDNKAKGPLATLCITY